MNHSYFQNQIQKFQFLFSENNDDVMSFFTRKCNNKYFIFDIQPSGVNNFICVLCVDDVLAFIPISYGEVIIDYLKKKKDFQTIFVRDYENIKIVFKHKNKPLALETINYNDNMISSFLEYFPNTIENFYLHDILPKKLIDLKIKYAAGLLLQKGFINSRINRINIIDDFFNHKPKIIKFNINDFLILTTIGSGSGGSVKLIYYLKEEKIFALKLAHIEETGKLDKREYDNYLKIQHPFLPKIYGTVNYCSQECIVFEYIEGNPLYKIKELFLRPSHKKIIILEIMFVIKLIHENNMIYRDLNPSNIIIDRDNNAIVIDLDRMVDPNTGTTVSFADIYVAPEIVNGKPFSFSADIYSLGLLIYYILLGEKPQIENGNQNNNTVFSFNKLKKWYSEIIPICEKCTQIDPSKRPNINVVIDEFIEYIINYVDFIFEDNCFGTFLKILESMGSSMKIKFLISSIYDGSKFVPKDNNKKIIYLKESADLNYPEAQYKLGMEYLCGKNVRKDINKAIHYLTLSANQNNAKAQYELGMIFNSDKEVSKNIQKSIYYLKLSANQNFCKAQFDLGMIYFEFLCKQKQLNEQSTPDEKYFANQSYMQNVKEMIFYLEQAALQNHSLAQYFLGMTYYMNYFKVIDSKKAIFYLTLSANQNCSDAQYVLGIIYSNGEYVKKDIKKAINYFSLSANQNNSDAQYHLGCIYFSKNYNEFDIKKSIYYFTLSANQNNSNAQYKLGIIYFYGEYVKKDIKKAINYFSLSANQNNSDAQGCLGYIYYSKKFNVFDIKKGIYFLTLSANQNNTCSQYLLIFIRISIYAWNYIL